MVFKISENEFRSTYKLQAFADKIIKNKTIKFPYKPSSTTTKIVSFLTFDGHLTPGKKMFLFTSGNLRELNNMEFCNKKEFGITGKYRKIDTNKYGTSYEYRICSAPIGRLLGLLGVPGGSKVLNEFNIPEW